MLSHSARHTSTVLDARLTPVNIERKDTYGGDREAIYENLLRYLDEPDYGDVVPCDYGNDGCVNARRVWGWGMKDLICPIMSYRVTSLSEPKDPQPKITPTIVKCQRAGCAWWEAQSGVCAPLAMVIETIKLGGE